MSKQRKFLLISAAIGFISMFLPWVSISMFGYTQNANGMHKEGVVVFICFVATGIISVIDDQKRNLDKTMWTIALLAGAIALLFVIWYYSEITSSFMGDAFVGFGLYVAGLAAIGILLSAYFLRSPGDNIKEGFVSLKEGIKNKFGNSVTTSPTIDATKSGQNIDTPSENNENAGSVV